MECVGKEQCVWIAADAMGKLEGKLSSALLIILSVSRDLGWRLIGGGVCISVRIYLYKHKSSCSIVPTSRVDQ